MGESSKIEWTDATFNPWLGCAKVSPGCDHCYAEGWAKRSGMVTWGEARRRTSPANWRKPLHWHASIPDGKRLRVFCASLADVFDNQVPDEWREDLWALIRKTPRIDWLLLTKRIGNVKDMLPPDWSNSIYGYNNVWLGISVVNQPEADRDIEKLLRTPARVRFLSCEPLLGPIRFNRLHSYCPIHDYVGGFCSGDCRTLRLVEWVIVGGESGHKARPMEPHWAAGIIEDCDEAGIAVFFKQGSQANWPDFKNYAALPAEYQRRSWPRTQP